MSATHRLDASVVHYEWNNAIPPRLVVEPGDTIVLDTRDAADGYYTPTSTSRDTAARGPVKGHPLTGPIAVRGARPGDVLVVEIVAMEPAPFGWTHIRPGRGLSRSRVPGVLPPDLEPRGRRLRADARPLRRARGRSPRAVSRGPRDRARRARRALARCRPGRTAATWTSSS